MRKLWIGLAVLVFVSPLGLILPARFGAGSAWGEWSAGELDKMVGYMPGGMARISDMWKSPMPDYASKGHGSSPLAYIVSALIGASIVIVLTLLLGKLLARRENEDGT
jgi:hypothetical protein